MILNTITSSNLLIDAYKFYSRGDARAHDALKIITERNDMTAAVLGCLEDATKEEEPEKQNLYVQAANFGKKFHPGVAIDEFQSTCRLLRVMNVARSENLENIGDIKSVINQLVAKQKFDLALWAVGWLKVEGEKQILTEWIEYIMGNRYLKDEQVAAKIHETLGRNPIVPYAGIANKAIEHSRIELAIKLIEKESQSSEQIQILLSLKRYDLVLARALATCNSNLIFMAIFKLKENMLSEFQFLELLKKHPLAFKYYCNFLTITDIPKLILICHADGMKEELELYLLENRLEPAIIVAKSLKQDFVSHQIETRLRLTRFQQGIKNINPPPKAQQASWVGLSISETIINLVALGQTNKAKDCQKKFDVADKKYRVLEQMAMNILPTLHFSDR